MKVIFVIIISSLTRVAFGQVETIYVEVGDSSTHVQEFFIKELQYFHSSDSSHLTAEVYSLNFQGELFSIRCDNIVNGKFLNFTEIKAPAHIIIATQSFKDLTQERSDMMAEANQVSTFLGKKLEDVELAYKLGRDTLSDFEKSIILNDIENTRSQIENFGPYQRRMSQILNGRLIQLMLMYLEAIEYVAKKKKGEILLGEGSLLLTLQSSGEDVSDQVKDRLVKMDDNNPVHSYKSSHSNE